MEDYKKKYEEALERAKMEMSKDGMKNDVISRHLAETIFPELAESEDERIRKELLEHCKNLAEPYILTGNECPQIQSWIDWLEKQKVQPKQECSEKDVCMINNIIDVLKPLSQTTHSGYAINSMINWLKSFKDRVLSQPKQEWSEKDEKMLASIIRFATEEEIGWLKSLRPQNKWKPSDEQIRCLKEVVSHRNLCGLSETALNELLADLKKLIEE